MAGDKLLTKQRHKDVREMFARLSATNMYKYKEVIRRVAKATRYKQTTVERIVCTQDEEVLDNSLKLF